MIQTDDSRGESVRGQLRLLRQSATFARSVRLMALLDHLVEAKLAGGERLLTESAIGNKIYGRPGEYDARVDSTVRVEAGRLRRKLAEYYGSCGSGDRILIDLPVGSYVPVITANPAHRILQQAGPLHSDSAVAGYSRPSIAVLPFQLVAAGGTTQWLAQEFTEELAFMMTTLRGWRVASQRATARHLHLYGLHAFGGSLGVDVVIHGTLRRLDERVRVTVEAADPDGFVRWHDRAEARDCGRLDLLEHLARTLVGRMRLAAEERAAIA